MYMEEILDKLIDLGEQVLATETTPSNGMPHPSTVSGRLTDEWKEKCKALFANAPYNNIPKFLSARTITTKQAKDLLEQLKAWREAL